MLAAARVDGVFCLQFACLKRGRRSASLGRHRRLLRAAQDATRVAEFFKLDYPPPPVSELERRAVISRERGRGSRLAAELEVVASFARRHQACVGSFIVTTTFLV